MDLRERGPTGRMGSKDEKTLVEMESKFAEMVEKKEARVEEEKDQKGNVISYKIIGNDGTLLHFVDRERLQQLNENKKI